MAASTGNRPTAIITGANAGIGLHTAIGLARAGMRVVMVGRDPQRLATARQTAAERAAGAELDTAVADFASLDAVRALAADMLARHARIDVLVNNAGLIAPRFARSADGYEMTIAVNHLAPFLLTNLLLDRLTASAPARVITVASAAHKDVRLNPATMTDAADWTALAAYGRSKLTNVLFTRALARRLDPKIVVAACLHPGVIGTDIGNHAGGVIGLGWRLGRLFMRGPEEGAETSIFLATTPDPTPFHGAYVVGKAIAGTDPAARDERLGEALWQESGRLVGLVQGETP